MKTSRAVVILSLLTGILAFIQSGLGLFWQDGGSPFSFAALHRPNRADVRAGYLPLRHFL